MRYTVYAGTAPSPLRINHLGFARDDEGTRFAAGQRDCYIIHYVTKGTGVFNGNEVHAGQGFLIRPEQLAEYHRLESDPWELLWILSGDAQMQSILDRYDTDGESMIFDYGSTEPARELAAYVIQNHHTIKDPLVLEELFLHLCNSHLQKHPAARYQPNFEVYLDFCTSYIENNMHKKIGTGDLTALLGVTQPYLYKIFFNRFGIGPKAYIISRKMQRAKRMLRETALTVTQISNSLGYSDPLTFSKAFKASEGISPDTYRSR